MYERMEPLKYPEPRDIRNQLQRLFINKYKNESLSNINLSTEFILKSYKPKSGGPEIILLKYRIINLDWDNIKNIKDIKFNSKMFRWDKGDEPDYADYADNEGF